MYHARRTDSGMGVGDPRVPGPVVDHSDLSRGLAAEAEAEAFPHHGSIAHKVRIAFAVFPAAESRAQRGDGLRPALEQRA